MPNICLLWLFVYNVWFSISIYLNLHCETWLLAPRRPTQWDTPLLCQLCLATLAFGISNRVDLLHLTQNDTWHGIEYTSHLASVSPISRCINLFKLMSFTTITDQNGKLIHWLTSIMSDLHGFECIYLSWFSLQSRVFYLINSYFVQIELFFQLYHVVVVPWLALFHRSWWAPTYTYSEERNRSCHL